MERIEREFSLGEVTMAFSEIAATGEHEFVLIHGIGMGRIVYSEIADLLAQRGRVLAVDLPGFGDSPEPGTAATLEQTGEVVAQFIRAESERPVVLIGHSMGTQIVAEVAAKHPELVEALVLIAPTVNSAERTALAQSLRMVQDLFGEGPKVLFTGLWAYTKTSPVWFINKLRFMLDHRLEDLCPHIPAPTLVLRGETDRVCPRKWVSQIAAAFPNGTMAEIPGRGHEAIIKSPEPAGPMILDFLVQHTARA